jgi:hypothetical protein
MTDLLRIALKGTIATGCTGDEQAILRNVGFVAMQRMGGYIAPAMPVTDVKLQPPEPRISYVSNYMMMAFCDDFFVPPVDAGVPFMLIAWIYIGTDNEFRLVESIRDKVLIRHIVFMLLSIVCGGAPTARQIKVTMKYAEHIRAESSKSLLRIDEAIALTLLATCEIIRDSQKKPKDIVGGMLNIGNQITNFVDNAVSVASFYRERPRQVKGTIQAKAVNWMTLTESDQLQIAHEWLLMLVDDH